MSAESPRVNMRVSGYATRGAGACGRGLILIATVVCSTVLQYSVYDDVARLTPQSTHVKAVSFIHAVADGALVDVVSASRRVSRVRVRAWGVASDSEL